MGALSSADKLRAAILPGDEEVPLAVLETSRWPDGSLMIARVAFPAAASAGAGRTLWIAWDGPARARNFIPDSNAPRAAFSVGPEQESSETRASQSSIVMAAPVGQMMARLDRHPELYYYWHLIPIAAILGLLIYRKVRMG